MWLGFIKPYALVIIKCRCSCVARIGRERNYTAVCYQTVQYNIWVELGVIPLVIVGVGVPERLARVKVPLSNSG